MVDAFDLRLLGALYRNGRAPANSLARVVGLSEGACRNRMKALERSGVIEGYSALISFERLGAFLVWADADFDESDAASRLEQAALDDPRVAGVWLAGREGHVRLLVVTAGYDDWLDFSRRIGTTCVGVRQLTATPVFRSLRPGPAFPDALLSALAGQRR